MEFGGGRHNDCCFTNTKISFLMVNLFHDLLPLLS